MPNKKAKYRKQERKRKNSMEEKSMATEAL